jgi:hypothetical protein
MYPTADLTSRFENPIAAAERKPMKFPGPGRKSRQEDKIPGTDRVGHPAMGELSAKRIPMEKKLTTALGKRFRVKPQ